MFSERKNPSAARVSPVCLSPTYIFVVNRLLRKIFLPKREQVTGDWRKLRNEELHDLFSLRWSLRVGRDLGGREMWRVWEEENLYRVLMCKREGNRSLERPRRRWENDIKMDIKKTWEGVELVYQAQNRDYDYELRGIPCAADERAAVRCQTLCCVELIACLLSHSMAQSVLCIPEFFIHQLLW